MCLIIGTLANSADPDQRPQNTASHQGLHCLLTGFSIRNKIKMEKHTTPLKLKMDFFQKIRMDEPTMHIWVNYEPHHEKTCF